MYWSNYQLKNFLLLKTAIFFDYFDFLTCVKILLAMDYLIIKLKIMTWLIPLFSCKHLLKIYYVSDTKI